MHLDDATTDTLRKQHSHRIPDDDAQRLLKRIRQEFLNLSVFCAAALPRSRELALVQTKLDEARMWACNAATSSGEVQDVLTINRPVLPDVL